MSSKTAHFRHFLSLSLKNFFAVFLVGLVLMVATSGTASAQALYWDSTGLNPTAPIGGSGTWGSAANWSNLSTDSTWVQGDSAVFGATAGSVSVVGTQSVSGIYFAQTSGSYTLGGPGVIAFTSGGTNSLGENVIGYSSASTNTFNETINTTITGSNGLYFGPTSGTVGGTSQQLNFIINGTNTGLSGTTATLDNSTFLGTEFLQLVNSNALGTIANLNVIGGGGTTYQGTTKYGGPQVYLGTTSSTSATTFNFNLNYSGSSAGVVYGGLKYNTTLNGNITFSNIGGSFRDSTANTTTYLNGGTLTNSNATTTTTTNFGVATGNGVHTSSFSIGDLIENNPNNTADKLQFTIQATGSGDGSAGVVYLTNTNNSYTGPTVVDQGILNVASLALGGSNSSIGASSSSAANLVLFGNVSAITSGENYSGELQYTGSTAQTTDRLFQIGDNGGNGSTTLYNNAVIDASGTTSTATVNFIGTGALTYDTVAGTVSNAILVLTGTNTGLNTFMPLIGDAGTTATTANTSLYKEGTGTWVLENNNSYTGGTTIVAGTLLVANNGNGGTASGTGSGNVSVSGTLGGTGYVGNSVNTVVTVNSGGTLAPGLAPGTAGLLTINNALTFLSGAKLTFDINGPGTAGTNYDSAAVGGALAYNGTLTLNLTADAGTSSYNLFTFGSESGDLSGITLSGLYSGSLTDSSGVWTGSGVDSADSATTNFTYTDSTGILSTVTTVPEPSVIWLMLGGLGLLGFVRRLRRNNIG